MYKPRITIITAVYNRVDTVEQCILSVINQTYDNLEYIIIDGGSTDGTVDVIRKYADKIAYWCSESDKGIYDAWNKGVSHATGDYINFIGSDDVMYGNNVIKNMVSYLDKSVDVLAGSIMVVNEKTCFEFINNNSYVINKADYKGGCIATQGTFAKRELCNKYKFDISYKIAADYKFFLQYYYDSSIRIKFVDEIVQYFSDEGVSSIDWDFVRNEDNIIYKELGLDEFVDCHLRNNKNGVLYKTKEQIKGLCKKAGVFEMVQQDYHLYIKGDWKKHHCNNKICRWCGRYE